MTRKEKEKLVLDALTLKVGDKIIIPQSFYKDYEIIELKDKYALKTLEKSNIENFPFDNEISTLLHYDFTKINSKKKKGELLCGHFCYCLNCPLYSLRCEGVSAYSNLYDALEYDKNHFNIPEEVYKIYTKILDEEVEDE